MDCRTAFPIALCCALSLSLVAAPSRARDRATAADAEVIYNVVEARLHCGTPTTVSTLVHPQRSDIQRSGLMPIGDLGYRIDFKRLPEFREWTAAVSLGDRSRGVEDNYVLLSRTGLVPFEAAYVVTRLPEGMTAEDALPVVQQMQRNSAGVGRASFTAAETPFGPGLEMVVGDRVGSACFPTSPFRYATAGEPGGIGISRFVVRERDLIEYALVLPWPDGAPQSRVVADAQARMDTFQRALEWVPSRATDDAR